MAGPRARRRDGHEDDEEVRRRRKRKKGGVPLWVWLVCGGVGMLLVCGGGLTVGVLVYSGVLGGGSGLPAILGGTTVTAANYNRLQKDMTQAEVHSILGPPTRSDKLASLDVVSVWTETWEHETDQHETDKIMIMFTNGKASGRSCSIKHSGPVQLTDDGLLPW